jgi:hypothetical protein
MFVYFSLSVTAPSIGPSCSSRLFFIFSKRCVAVGRKNHYGSRSERGTRVAALLYSLIESAKLAGVEPRANLAEAARRAIRNPGTVTLPRDFK